MADFAIVQLGAARVHETTKVPLVQAINPGTDDESGEPFGELPTYASLGITALPFPKTAGGWCEGFIAKEAAGLDGVVLGARDTRSASIYGELKPGDTIVHSTGPNQAAMVMCKEVRKQVVVRTRDSANKDMMVVLDGTDDKVTISAFKCIFEMTRGQVIIGAQGTVLNAAIIIDGEAGKITLNAGQIHLGGTPLGSNGACYNIPGTPTVTNLASTSVFVSPRARIRRFLLGLLAEFQLGVELARVSV